jgi:hypothetical protein
LTCWMLKTCCQMKYLADTSWHQRGKWAGGTTLLLLHALRWQQGFVKRLQVHNNRSATGFMCVEGALQAV